MKELEYNWKSYDGLNYYAKSWSNGHHAKGIINLIHGIGEHCLRYEELAMKFLDNGFDVITMDYRGHGKSEGKRGHTPAYRYFMHDVDLLLSKSSLIFPNKPVIIYGHSLGGNLAINYVLRRKPAIYGLIATSPWLKLAFEPSRFQLSVASVIKNIYPSLTQKTGLKTKSLTKNPDVVEKYENDDLVHGKITVKTFFDVRQAGEYALKHAHELYVPTLIMHGSADQITSEKASAEFAENNKYVTLKIWDDFYHELHNEAEKEKVFDYVIQWLINIID